MFVGTRRGIIFKKVRGGVVDIEILEKTLFLIQYPAFPLIYVCINQNLG